MSEIRKIEVLQPMSKEFEKAINKKGIQFLKSEAKEVWYSDDNAYDYTISCDDNTYIWVMETKLFLWDELRKQNY